MMIRINTKKVLATLFALVIAFAAVPLFAQADSNQQAPSAQQQSNIEVSDAELKKFVSAMKAIQEIQRSSQEKIEKAFSDSSLSKKRFNELYKAKQQQGQDKAEGETEQETKAYNNIMEQIKTIRSSDQEKMMQALKDNSISVERFNKIAQAMRSDQELAKRIQEYM